MRLTQCFIIVNIDSFKLKVRVSGVSTSRINTMFIRDDFPKLESKKSVQVKKNVREEKEAEEKKQKENAKEQKSN